MSLACAHGSPLRVRLGTILRCLSSRSFSFVCNMPGSAVVYVSDSGLESPSTAQRGLRGSDPHASGAPADNYHDTRRLSISAPVRRDSLDESSSESSSPTSGGSTASARTNDGQDSSPVNAAQTRVTHYTVGTASDSEGALAAPSDADAAVDAAVTEWAGRKDWARVPLAWYRRALCSSDPPPEWLRISIDSASAAADWR